MESDKSLLSAELNSDFEEALYEQMLLKAKQELQSRLPSVPESKQIRPQPGFCIKTRTAENTKIFINICKTTDIPAPPDLSEAELVNILESDDPSGYRVPMSIGEPHVEVDNNGNGCTAYDIVINSSFFDKIKKVANAKKLEEHTISFPVFTSAKKDIQRFGGYKFPFLRYTAPSMDKKLNIFITVNLIENCNNSNELFREFFVTVAMEGLENKYEMELSREWRMLKNRKFMGSISDQNIRTKSKPIIQEMDTSYSGKPQSKPLITEIQSSPVVPEYSIVAEPVEGHPSFLVAEISLPKVSSVKSLVLDLGEDRIVLWGRPDLYHMDIFIPYNIIQEKSGAQFNQNTKVLTITMPVQPL